MSSKEVTSNQLDIHPDLEDVVKKHLVSEYKKPIRRESINVFESIQLKLDRHSDNLILDSCCGVGESTIRLAKKNPDQLVIGIDKSGHRTDKFYEFYRKELSAPENCLVVCCDIYDFWKLFLENGFSASTHNLFYPNPWPKKQHLMRRVHGHPLFPLLPKLSDHFVLRTNWQIYAKEMQLAFQFLGEQKGVLNKLLGSQPISPFERKYLLSNQEIYQLNQVLRAKVK